MKKLLLIALVLCTACVAGTLFATMSQDVVTAEPTVAADGLPTTVLEQVSADIAKCPRWDVMCPDVWDPVTCSNGVTYSNSCYAYRACATGCTSGGATF